MDYIGIGWDVGGWMGEKNAIAAVGWKFGRELEWLLAPRRFRLPGHRYDLTVNNPLWQTVDQLLGRHPAGLALGIDASLAMPAAYVRLVSQGTLPRVHFQSGEINNKLAYRYTERQIHKKFHKKPLSASFDSLGNAATVAMCHLPLLKNRLSCIPFEAEPGPHRMLEVYPALAKGSDKRVLPFLDPWMPDGVDPGSDEYDAAICALMALAAAAQGVPAFTLLPPLVGPRKSNPLIRQEGWIYHFKR